MRGPSVPPDDVIHIEFERREALALVTILDALMNHGFLSTGVLSVIGVSSETLRLADLAGAKLLLKL